MRGYIIVEASSEISCRDLILNEPHVKGMLAKPLEETELEGCWHRSRASRRYQ